MVKTKVSPFSEEFLKAVIYGWNALNLQQFETNPEKETISNLKKAIKYANFYFSTIYESQEVIDFMFNLSTI